MKRIGQMALVCATMVISGCATAQDATQNTTTASAAPTTTAVSNKHATPLTLHDGSLAAGTYVATPFAEEATICTPSQSGCIDPVGAESIRFTFTVPPGWSGFGTGGIWLGSNAPPSGAAMIFNLGGWVYSDPCRKPDEGSADVPVGLTVDDFANALADHPLFEVTAPVDVTLGGYAGKSLDLQAPSDISGCDAYRPFEYWLYAQGSGHRWHLSILDVNGVRVVVQAMDYEDTTAKVQAELEAIVDSIQIEP